MANLNKVFLMGNLTADPELRYIPSGKAVADLRMAVNRRFTTKEGEQREDTLFVDVVVWQKQAENCSQYLSKGSPIMVEGRLHLDTWETEQGEKRSRLRVVAENVQFLGRRGDAPGGEKAPRQAPPKEEGGPEDIGEDDIPF